MSTTLKPGFKISSKTGLPYRVHGNTVNGVTAKDARGNSRDRAARRAWILSPAAGFGGNGATVPCVHCHKIVTADLMHVDRIVPGGTYRRNNIQPSCAKCNHDRCNNPNWTPKVTAS